MALRPRPSSTPRTRAEPCCVSGHRLTSDSSSQRWAPSSIFAPRAPMQVDLRRQLDLQTHLASLGRVTAGFTHEVSNPLAVLQSNHAVALECLEHFIAGDRPATSPRVPEDAYNLTNLREALDDMSSALERMSSLLALTRDLSQSARGARMEQVSLPALVEDVVEMDGESCAGSRSVAAHRAAARRARRPAAAWPNPGEFRLERSVGRRAAALSPRARACLPSRRHDHRFGSGQRTGDGSGDSRPDLRAVFHYAQRTRGHGAWSCALPRVRGAMRARLHALDRGRARLLLPRSPARWVIGALTPRKAPHDKAPRRLAASSCAPSWVSRKPASQPARSAAGWPALARSGTSRHIP